MGRTRLELARPGKWNSVDLTAERLQQIVTNFGLLSPGGGQRVPLKRTHNDEGPAAGWIDTVQIEPDGKLVGWADFTPQAADEVKRGDWRSLSVEIVTDWQKTEAGQNLKIPGVEGFVLRAAALLGAKQPAVKGLAPVTLSELRFFVETPLDGCDDCGLATREQIAEFAGNIEGLAQHIVDKYGADHPFTECMNAAELQSYDDNTKTLICGRVKALKGEASKGMTEKEVDYVLEYLKMAEGDVTKGGEFVGGFDGCVQHMMNTKGLPEENARKLCAFIGRQAGKIPMSEPLRSRSAPPLLESRGAARMPDDKSPDQTRIEQLEAQLAERDKAIADHTAAMAAKDAQTAKFSDLVKENDTLKAQHDQLAERFAAIEARAAEAEKEANRAKAREFADELSKGPDVRLWPSQKAMISALFERLSDEESIPATEAKDLKCFAETETAKPLSTRELLRRALLAAPSKAHLFREWATQNKTNLPDGATGVEDIKVFAEKVASEMNLDMKDPQNLRAIYAEVRRRKPDLTGLKSDVA